MAARDTGGSTGLDALAPQIEKSALPRTRAAHGGERAPGRDGPGKKIHGLGDGPCADRPRGGACDHDSPRLQCRRASHQRRRAHRADSAAVRGACARGAWRARRLGPGRQVAPGSRGPMILRADDKPPRSRAAGSLPALPEGAQSPATARDFAQPCAGARRTAAAAAPLAFLHPCGANIFVSVPRRRGGPARPAAILGVRNSLSAGDARTRPMASGLCRVGRF